MSDPFSPEPKGAFTSFLDWLDEPGQVVRNLVKGRPGAALRNAGDFLLDPFDAALPGDWIDSLATGADKLSASELVNIDRTKHPVGAFLTDVGLGMALDPLTYVPGGLIAKGLAKAGAAGRAVVKALPAGEAALEGLDTAGRTVRSIAGAQRISPATRKILDTASAARSAEGEAGRGAVKASILGSLLPDEAQIVGDAMDNWRWEGGKLVGKLTDDIVDPIKRVASHPDVRPEQVARLQDAVAEAMNIGQQQAKRENVFSKKVAPDPLLFGAETAPQTAFDGTYLPRTYTGQKESQIVDQILGKGSRELGTPSPIQALEMSDPAVASEFLAANPKVKYERNATIRLAKRADAQGVLSQRAEIGKAILGDGFALADDGMRAHVEDSIRAMAKESPEDARMLMDAFSGVAPRGAVLDTIAKMNHAWKPLAVYGAVVPKVGTNIRNKIAGVWGAFSNPESRGVALAQLKRFDGDLIGAVADSLGLSYPRDKLKGVIDQVGEALGQSGGRAEHAVSMLERAGNQDGADLLRHGVLDGFVRSEDLAAEMTRTPWQKKFSSIFNWPGRIFRGVEDRMRAGMFLDLKRMKGLPGDEAARITKDSLFDYNVSSVGNRTARDIIPFFQFSAKAIPQQAKLLAEKPWLAVGLSQAAGSAQGGNVYPFMDGRLNIPIGTNEQGDTNYLSGLGLPFESLNMIPNPSADLRDFGRQLERDVIGQSQPLLKSAFATASGEDPFFGTEQGSYTKLPGNIEGGDFGRYYNLAASTGATQAVDSAARTLGAIVDERRSPWEKGVDLLSGANVVSVDPDRALTQRLTEALQANPDVMQNRVLSSRSGDAETKALLEALRQAKARLKAERKAAMGVP